jgi:hypothetical protein
MAQSRHNNPAHVHAGRSQTRAKVALVLWAMAAAACGSSGSDPSAPPSPLPTDNASGKLQAASQPGALTAQAKALLQTRRTWLESLASSPNRPVALATPVTTSAPSTATAGASTGTSADAFSQTTRQEDGVDEDDLVKTDGKTLYSFGGTLNQTPTLQAHRRNADGSLSLLNAVALPSPTPLPSSSTSIEVLPFAPYQQIEGLMLAAGAKKLASFRQIYNQDAYVCQSNAPCPTIAYARVPSTIGLDLVATQDDGSLGGSTQVLIQGDVVSTRMVGTTLYLVSTHVPRLDVELAATQAQRDAALATLAPEQFLPTYRVNGGASQPLVQETQCYSQPGNTSRSLVVTTITAIDLGAANFAASSKCFLGGTEAVYATPTSVYLATSRWPEPSQDAGGRWVFNGDSQLRTDLHKFAIDGTAITYRASGAVTGHLGWDREKSPYRLSEHQGDLRVITFTGTQGWFGLADATSTNAPAPSPATLTVLRERTSDQTLQAVATLPNAQRTAAIGKPGEQVYGVRFAGERAYVVTFRRTDPLYVLDLANPLDPKQAGALEVTGFSDNLYPLAQGLLLGVGREADTNGQVTAVKVALFDVADAQQPSQRDARTFGGRGSTTALDASSQGISFLASGATVRVALPMALTPASNAGPFAYSRSLQRLEVDTASRTLRVLTPQTPPPLSASFSSSGYLVHDRSVHIGAHVYYYSEGLYSSGLW